MILFGFLGRDKNIIWRKITGALKATQVTVLNKIIMHHPAIVYTHIYILVTATFRVV